VFFFLPVGVDYESRRMPMVTFALMIINTLIHIAFMVVHFNNEEMEEKLMEMFWLTPASSPWYSYLTTMFVHGGIMHLLGNMVFLFLFGSVVEDMVGRWRYLAFYLVSGIVAAFGHIALTPGHFNSELPLGGASGAISACMGAFVLLVHKMRVEFRYFVWIFFRIFMGEFTVPAWLMMTFWFGSDVFGALTDKGNEGGVAFGAHIGGFVFGMIFILCMKPILRREEAREATGGNVREESSELVSPIPADAAIHIIDNGVQAGPYTLGELWQYVQSGQISKESFYWYEGLPDWKKLKDVF
jgi:membrane associated rhomboid family serine protease